MASHGLDDRRFCSGPVTDRELVATGFFIQVDGEIEYRITWRDGFSWEPLGSGAGLGDDGESLTTWDGGMIVG